MLHTAGQPVTFCHVVPIRCDIGGDPDKVTVTASACGDDVYFIRHDGRPPVRIARETLQQPLQQSVQVLRRLYVLKERSIDSAKQTRDGECAIRTGCRSHATPL